MADSPTPTPAVELAGFLARCRARLTTRQRWATFGSVLVVWAAGAWALLIVAGLFGPWLVWRTLTLALVVLTPAAALVQLSRRRRAVRSDDDVARRVSARLPALGSDLLSAVELGRERARLEAQPVLSLALVDALEASVATRVRAADPVQLFDTTRLRRAALRTSALIGAAYLASALLLPGGLRRAARLLWGDGAAQPLLSQKPLVGDITLRLHYPAYTRLPPRDLDGSTGQILAPPGTRVELEAHALRPTLGAAELYVEEDGVPARSVRLDVAGARLSGTLDVTRPGRYRFVLGRGPARLGEEAPHRIDIDPDRAPRVDLFGPGEGTLELQGARRVELGYSVDDDYGLGEATLVWKQPSGAEQRRIIRPAPAASEADDVERAASGKYEWDLGDLELKPGERVAYHLEAKDNCDRPAPHVGSSRTLYLSVYNPREKHESAVAEQEQLLEKAIAHLADRLELPEQLKKSGDEQLGPFAAIAPRAEALLAQLTRTEQAVAADTGSAGRDVRTQLAEMYGRLHKLVKDEAQLLSELTGKRRRGPLAPGAVRPLESSSTRLVSELERDVILLDDLLGRQRLEDLLSIADQMAKARDRLKQLIAQYKSTKSDAVKKDIERELRDLERKISELKARAASLSGELPDEYLNRDAMTGKGLDDQLAKVREQMAKGDADGALAAMEKLSSSLDSMVSSMEGDLRGYRRERFSAEEKALAELENKVRDLEHDQKQLLDETKALDQKTRRDATARLKDRIDPVVKRAREQVAKLKKQLEAVDTPTLGPFERDELDRARKRAQDLDRMLAQGDLDEARGMAQEAHKTLAELSQDLRAQEQRIWRDLRAGVKRSREHVEQSEQLAREIHEQLEQAMPKPGEMLSPEDAQRMGELSGRQAATRRRAGELDHELQQRRAQAGRGQGGPPSSFSDLLRDAGGHMDKAGGKLSQRAASGAQTEEQQALDKLGQLRQQLSEERRPRDQMSGGAVDKEPVRIPGAEEYQAPKAFRQELLDAMKRGAPAEYKDQVKRYYEELVK